jgi:hypothetical protein
VGITAASGAGRVAEYNILMRFSGDNGYNEEWRRVLVARDN